MAPTNAQEREFSVVEQAMLHDIGVCRIIEFPLQDDREVPRTGRTMDSIENGRTGTDNRWNQAIAEGAFEDDDAAVVAGQSELANGQLARMRRAADLSYMAVNRGIGFDDRRIRQNRNGQVGPRAQFFRGDRGPARAGLAHAGDGPVELRGAIRNSRHAALPAPLSSANTQRRAGSSTNGTLPPVLSNARASNQAPSSRAQPLNEARPPAQPPAAVPTVPQEEVRARSTTVSLELLDGQFVLFQAPVTFASPAFLNRTAEYPGTIYLVTGTVVADDQIILHIDEDNVEDVKRRTIEYMDYLADSDRLILQFKDDSGKISWFVVVFHQRDFMVSCVEALRKLIGRLKQSSPSPAATNIGPPAVGTPAVPIEPRRDISGPTIKSPQQQDTGTIKTISVAILEEIVSWAMTIVACVRDSGPDELANADALPGIIRGVSAEVLIEKHAGFLDLDSEQRVAFVDEVCAPQVFERFKRRMLEDAAKGPTKAVPITAPSTQKSPDVQEVTPSERPRPKYTIQELIQLKSTAVDPPDFLTELRYLPEMNPENRALVQKIIEQAQGLHGASLPVQAAQVSQRATDRPLVMDSPKAGYSLDGHSSPARERNAGSRKPVAVSVHAAPAPSTLAPGVTVTAPVEEALISIHGEMSGLNSSRHNMNGSDLLGQSAGKFTGALSRNKSNLEDLVLIDRVEDFEVIRANDPEVA